MHPHAALANEVGVEALDLEVVGGLDPVGFEDGDYDGAVAVRADQFRSWRQVLRLQPGTGRRAPGVFVRRADRLALNAALGIGRLDCHLPISRSLPAMSATTGLSTVSPVASPLISDRDPLDRFQTVECLNFRVRDETVAISQDAGRH